jgi:outer membrane protein TolC
MRLLVVAGLVTSSAFGQFGATQTSGSAFQGSVAQGTATGERLPISLTDAIARGIRTNLGTLLANQNVRRAEGAHGVARSELLPHLTTSTTESSQQINLAAFGFTSFPGIADIVGPFGIFDARGFLTQPLLDFKSRYNNRATAAEQNASTLNSRDARDIVALGVTGLYLETEAGASRIETGQAQVEVAQAAYDQAVDFQKNGVVPAIEVLRAQVELQTQQQRLIAYRSDVEKLKLRLARAIGLPDGQGFDLSDNILYSPPPAVKTDEAITRAYESRNDYQSAEVRVKAAQLALKAAGADRLPRADFNGNYGVIGPSPEHSHGTYTASVNLSFPIFQGGRTKAEELEADAELERRKAELGELRGRIAFEVRTAYIEMASAGDRTDVARNTIDLSQRQLTQARDRFAAGVASNLEVVQAQEAVAVANENYISSLYAYNSAKASLARSMGNAERNIPTILQGVLQ